MRLKRPRPTSLDEVRITREGDIAVIEYADPGIRGVNVRFGPQLAAMTDADVLESFNAMLGAAARDSDTTANRLLSELAAQWLENREWPRSAVQIRVARSSLFAAQAIARDMKKAGRQQEIDEILEYAALIVPDHAPASSAAQDHSADEPHVSESFDQK